MSGDETRDFLDKRQFEKYIEDRLELLYERHTWLLVPLFYTYARYNENSARLILIGQTHGLRMEHGDPGVMTQAFIDTYPSGEKGMGMVVMLSKLKIKPAAKIECYEHYKRLKCRVLDAALGTTLVQIHPSFYNLKELTLSQSFGKRVPPPEEARDLPLLLLKVKQQLDNQPVSIGACGISDDSRHEYGIVENIQHTPIVKPTYLLKYVPVGEHVYRTFMLQLFDIEWEWWFVTSQDSFCGYHQSILDLRSRVYPMTVTLIKVRENDKYEIESETLEERVINVRVQLYVSLREKFSGHIRLEGDTNINPMVFYPFQPLLKLTPDDEPEPVVVPVASTD